MGLCCRVHGKGQWVWVCGVVGIRQGGDRGECQVLGSGVDRCEG